MHKAEQGRIITIETVSCLHSVNGTIIVQYANHDSESSFTAVRKECATPPCQGMSQHVTQFYQAFTPHWYCKWKLLGWEGLGTRLITVTCDITKIHCDITMTSPTYCDDMTITILHHSETSLVWRRWCSLGWKRLFLGTPDTVHVSYHPWGSTSTMYEHPVDRFTEFAS